MQRWRAGACLACLGYGLGQGCHLPGAGGGAKRAARARASPLILVRCSWRQKGLGQGPRRLDITRHLSLGQHDRSTAACCKRQRLRLCSSPRLLSALHATARTTGVGTQTPELPKCKYPHPHAGNEGMQGSGLSCSAPSLRTGQGRPCSPLQPAARAACRAMPRLSPQGMHGSKACACVPRDEGRGARRGPSAGRRRAPTLRKCHSLHESANKRRRAQVPVRLHCALVAE